MGFRGAVAILAQADAWPHSVGCSACACAVCHLHQLTELAPHVVAKLRTAQGPKMDMFLVLTETQAYKIACAGYEVDCAMFAPLGNSAPQGNYVPLKDSQELAMEAALHAWTLPLEAAKRSSSWLVLKLTASQEQVLQMVTKGKIKRDTQRSGWPWEGNLPLAAFSWSCDFYGIAPLGMAGWAERSPWLRARPLRQPPSTLCAECGAKDVNVWSAPPQSDWAKQDYCVRCWYNFALKANNPAEAGVPLARLLCRMGCGRPAAAGFPTCCRTCKWSEGGGQHGPFCEQAFKNAQHGAVAMECA